MRWHKVSSLENKSENSTEELEIGESFCECMRSVWEVVIIFLLYPGGRSSGVKALEPCMPYIQYSFVIRGYFPSMNKTAKVLVAQA